MQNNMQIAKEAEPDSRFIFAVLENKSDREDVKDTTMKHYIKATWSFESIIDADLLIHTLDGYDEKTVVEVKSPYIMLRYSGENFIKSYPKAGRDYTERKIISRTREYFYWNHDKSELIQCNKKTISTVAEAMVKKFIQQHSRLPQSLVEIQKYKNGQIKYVLHTKQGDVIVKLRPQEQEKLRC